MDEAEEAPDTIATDLGEPDTIDQGRRLIRANGAGGLSLVDRLAERLHRLTWRTPLHTMRLNGRHPLKLIAVPDDPVGGDAARGRALIDGRMTFGDDTVALAVLDMKRPGGSAAFADHVHVFGWLRDLSAVATRAQGSVVAEALTARWLDANADTVDAVGWRADLWGRRILMWTAHAPLILSSADLVYRSRVLNTLARGARHLDRGADKTPAGPARIAAWCGVVASGLLISGGDPRRAFGEAGLRRSLDQSLFDDGGSVTRSPAALLDSVALLSTLRESYAARLLEMPEDFSARLTPMVSALLGVTHGDRALASWQGGGPGTRDHLATVIAASGVRTRPLRQARDWGYQRLSSGSTVVLMDAAPPPVARLIEGGCASTLAFELSDGPHRVIVNCGGARVVQPVLAQGLRSTAAHSTLVLADTNSTAIHADGTLGRGVATVELSRQESDSASRIEASHDGYVRRFGLVHRRQLMLTTDGRELRGEDALLPGGGRGGRKARPGTIPFAIRFHLGQGVQASPTADGHAAILRVADGAIWQFRCRGATLTIDDSIWIDEAGVPLQTQQLVIAGEAAAGGASVSWALRRAA